MKDLRLHQFHQSGNSYKIRLTAAFLSMSIELVDYDYRKGETRTSSFLTKINANGRVPVLQIGTENATYLPESSAACYYLATNSQLIPEARLEHAQMLQWMFFEQYSHEPYIATLRFWLALTGYENLSDEQKALIPEKRKGGEAALDIMERHLEGRKWFAGDGMTLADIDLYAYTHVAADAGFELQRWPNVKSWCERVADVPRYISIDRR